jgi:hypothetical protein
LAVARVVYSLLVFASLFMSAWWKSMEGISKPKDFAMD